jgi:hypothetical protein
MKNIRYDPFNRNSKDSADQPISQEFIPKGELKLIDPSGKMETHSGDTLLVCTDETGDRKHRDPANPYFGVGGIVTTVNNYATRIDPQWQLVKKQAFPQLQSPFHSTSLRLKNNTKARKKLHKFFSDNDFGRFALFTSNKTQTNFDDDHTQPMIIEAFNTLVGEVLQPYAGQFSRVLFIHEDGGNTHKIFMDAFDQAQLHINGQPIKIQLTAISKTQGFGALEIADCILYAGLQEMRHLDAGSQDSHSIRKEVFDSAPKGNSVLKYVSDIKKHGT